jgi:hypothetical protein
MNSQTIDNNSEVINEVVDANSTMRCAGGYYIPAN